MPCLPGSGDASLTLPLPMNSTPPESDEIALLLAVARQDEAAFAALYDRMARPIFSLIVRIVRVRAEAEEVLQEAFWQIWESAPSYRPELGSPFCWMVTVARRKAIDCLRANSRHLQRIEEAQELLVDDKFAAPLALELLANNERSATVRMALARLGAKERRAIVWAFFDGLTHEEIATALRAPVGTVKARIRRGMLKLKISLAALREPGGNSGKTMTRKKNQSTTAAPLREDEALLAWTAPLASAPSAKVKTQLLARIRAAKTVRTPAPAGWRFESTHAAAVWRDAFPGVRMKTLSVDKARDVVMLLLQMAPCARFPDHPHDDRGDEGLVITGDVVMDGRVMGPGDYYHADAGTDHVNITSPSGCTALLSMRASAWRKWRERILAR